MKLYTKKGDKGQTQVYLHQSTRVDKDHLLLEAYGSLDEVNAMTGLLIAHLQDSVLEAQLIDIQKNLFAVGFAISADKAFDGNQITILEQHIDSYQGQLPVQTAFELPGGCQGAAYAQVCRTLCRKAERRLVSLHKSLPVPSECLAYINRLSDYFYILARYLNSQGNTSPHLL